MSQKSAETSDTEDEDIPAPRTPAKVLSQPVQENVVVEPNDETDLRQFDEAMDVEETPIDDLRTLGDAMPPADLPRHAPLASSLDDCDSTVTRDSASEATVDRGLIVDSVDFLTNAGASTGTRKYIRKQADQDPLPRPSPG